MNESSQPLLVTAAIILDGRNRILLARRKADAKAEALKWEFPGGKVEAFEHPEECLKREIKEELDLEISVEGIFDVASHVFQMPSGRSHIVLLVYLCRAASSEFRELDVEEARWIDGDEIDDFDFAAPDIPVVVKFKEWLGAASRGR